MRRTVQLIAMSLILSDIFLFIACSTNNEPTAATSLTEDEKNDLLQLREEEKLARDVYIYTYNKYGLNISSNISKSEQTHMDKVLNILISYDLKDPVLEENGAFSSEGLQILYNQLTAKVDLSVMDALIVGATIEDLDIKDIEEFSSRTTKDDILSMYANLMCGSRNHLRSYYAQIIAAGGSYTPVYISQSEFDAIVNSNNEQYGQ